MVDRGGGGEGGMSGENTLNGKGPSLGHNILLCAGKEVYPQSNGSLAIARDEYISMHRKCLSICGYTFFLQQSALWVLTKFKYV